MGNLDLSWIEAYGPFKTIRRKKRLQKKDKEKQLIQLAKTQKQLHKKRHDLPLVQLEQPYQRGWVRSFILREDVADSMDAEFFKDLLIKINTENFSHHKSFRVKRKRFGKKVFETKPQFLADISKSDWDNNKIPLTEKEKEHFQQKLIWSKNWNCWIAVYAFDQPWRYVLKVKPNMITHTKAPDSDLERELKEIDNYLTNNNLYHKMHRLTQSRKQAWKTCQKGKEKYKSPFINQPLFQIIAKTAKN